MGQTLRRFTLLAALLTASSPTLAAQETAASDRATIAARIDTFMTRCAENGLQGTLLVEADGQVLLEKGYGIADHESGRATTPATPYHLGSLGKQFTAAAILLLESEGRLRTSDSIRTYFPDAPLDKQAITLDQLLHHTSGLPYLPVGDLEALAPFDTVTAEILAYPLEFAPGERHAYANPGYTLLAAVIERVSGTDYDTFLRTRLFEPAGMSETGSDQDSMRWVGDKWTPSYAGSAPDPPLYGYPGWTRLKGAGSVVSTTGDLWKWEQALRNNRVLSPAATTKLFAPAVEVNSTLSHACGWNVARSARGTTVIMHAGDFGGFNVDMRRLVDEHATIIFLSNTRSDGRGYRDAVSVAVTRFLFGPPPAMPPARMPLNDEQKAKWNTRWEVASGDSIEASADGDVVWLRARSQAAMSILAGSDSAGVALETQLSSQASDVSARLLAGDLPGLATAFHPSLPAETHPSFVEFWQGVRDSLGAPIRVEVMGTAANPPAGGKSLIRLAGAIGAEVLSLDWIGGKVVNSEPVPDAAFGLAYFPVSPNRVARFDLWAGRTTTIDLPESSP